MAISIEVDFEAWKELTKRRKSESETYNDVIRALLQLETATLPLNDPDAWIVEGVSFPRNTTFRAMYKGKSYSGRVESGQLLMNGTFYSTPSAAARGVTGNSVNGWNFWECQRPGDTNYIPIDRMRKS